MFWYNVEYEKTLRIGLLIKIKKVFNNEFINGAIGT